MAGEGELVMVFRYYSQYSSAVEESSQSDLKLMIHPHTFTLCNSTFGLIAFHWEGSTSELDSVINPFPKDLEWSPDHEQIAELTR